MFSSSLNQDDTRKKSIYCLSHSAKEVETTLSKHTHSPEDLSVLLSPAAQPYLELMAQKAQALTKQRFGNTMQLFAPLYLSNECYNSCTYCGFSFEHQYQRKTLTDPEIIEEAKALKNIGFQHVLLLTGESPKKVGTDYISHAAELVKPFFSSVSIEIQPLNLKDYTIMRDHDVDGLTLYQETYDKKSYAKYHTFGKKRLFDERLDALEQGAKAEFYRINIGFLLGLSDWRFDAFALQQHLSYLQKKYWKTHYSVSFPRIKSMFGSFNVESPVSDLEFTQLIMAFRLCFPDLGITLSTREPKELRDNILPLGITMMSAESNTAPGGYTQCDAEGQFDISDKRSFKDIQKMLLKKGFEPVIKNWDAMKELQSQ